MAGADPERNVVTGTRPRRRRWMWWFGGGALAVVVALGAAVEYAIHHAEPILRRRVVASLEDRFKTPVALDRLYLSFANGIEVSGEGLRIGAATNEGGPPPVLTIRSFRFRTNVHQLLEPVMRISEVDVQGMQLNIPPKDKRGPLLAKAKHRRDRPKLSIVVDHIMCSDAVLTIETDKPGKQPMVFPIHDLVLHDVGGKKAMRFEAKLVNPKPVGDIASTGYVGPWDPDDPRETPVRGDYQFTNADLGPIKGVAGILSSKGNFDGPLDEIHVTGETETPNFSVDSSEHPVDLHTEFDATVDGTNGDTRLNHIHATFLRTVLEVSGLVRRASDVDTKVTGHVKNPGDDAGVQGHFITITVDSGQARIEDLLRLAVKTSPPLMRGPMTLHAHMAIPPGQVSVSKKIEIEGRFGIRNSTLSNAHWQETIDRLSARAQGNPDVAKADAAPVAQSQMSGSFTVRHGVIAIPDLHYQVPGAQVQLAGRYTVTGETFQFEGTVRTDATASAMLTGWKKWVAAPFDPLLKKDGAGLEVPVKIDGTRSDPKFGVDMGKLKSQVMSRLGGHGGKPKDETPQPTPPH